MRSGAVRHHDRHVESICSPVDVIEFHGAVAQLGHMTELFCRVLADFLSRYPPRLACRKSGHWHEDFQLERAHGLRLLCPAPASDVQIGKPPTSRIDSNSSNRYIWVIDGQGIPYILEEPTVVIKSSLPKHTNLTGGGHACMGGEMWFACESSLYISGGSGRYPPMDSHQMSSAAKVFESLAYNVISLGWDQAAGTARRYWEVGDFS